jgi:hypothetical protein
MHSELSLYSAWKRADAYESGRASKQQTANGKQPARDSELRHLSDLCLLLLPVTTAFPAYCLSRRLFAVYRLLFAGFILAFWLFASPLPFPYNSQLARSAELSSGGFAPTFSFGRVIFGGAVDGVEFGGRSRAGNR